MFTLVLLTVTGFTLIAVLYVYYTRNKYTTIDAFLTARGTLGTWTSAATIFASIMGAWILFSPAESGTWGGVTAFVGYALAQALSIIAFAVLGPKMRRIAPHGSSLTEFVYYRFGRSMYGVTLIVAVFYMAVFLSAELTGIALGIRMIMGLPLWATALLVGMGTLIYTTYGGIRGSIFTDTLQAAIIIPALLIAFSAALKAFGGLSGLTSEIGEIDLSLLSMGHRGGLEFTATLIIAIIAANLFHQGFWSRVYACRDIKVVQRSFIIAGITIIPVVAVAGSFGLMAVAGGALEVPSVAFFSVVLGITPPWVILVVLVLALALVMSSADTLINGIATVFTVDIARFYPDINGQKLRFWARVLTGIVCVVVIAVASRGYSVLYLFLVADLVCAGAVFPTFYGLYSERLTGNGAVISTLAGIGAGALLFPDPAFTRGSLLYSFLMALVVSTIISLVFCFTSRSAADLDGLVEKVYDIKA